MNPGGDAVLQVLGIGGHFHFTIFLERAQAFNGGGQFHAVVGSMPFTAPEFLLLIAITKDGGPPSRTGIADARAISDQLDLLQRASTGSDWKKSSTRPIIADGSWA